MKPIIIGAGLAGLSTALALAPMPVVLVSPCALGEGCSSAWAQGGIAAAVGADDQALLHAKDTLAAGNGLNDAAIVQQVTNDGAKVIERLTSRGVVFDRDAEGQLRLGLEAAHSRRRIVHATDATGLAITQALIRAARLTPSIEIIEGAEAQDIIGNGLVTGVILRRGNERVVLQSSHVVLATGGTVGLWRDTTNPHENWGGGLAVAARAGATLGDLEFVQFHPTAIDIGRDLMPLASEALRGEGAVLIDETGSRFTEELQPRDIVARAIWNHIGQGHRVYLDARQALGDQFKARFPTIYAVCLSANIDPTKAPIPVRPAAHYHMGGIVTDAHGRTDLPGLWACGEVACTGLHGANRLASNSLLEAASFGQRVAEDIAGKVMGEKANRVPDNVPFLQAQKSGISGMTKEEIGAIRATMSDNVGVIRDKDGLTEAIKYLEKTSAYSDMAFVGWLIARCALQREESRGAHFRSDFPETKAAGQRSRAKLARDNTLTITYI